MTQRKKKSARPWRGLSRMAQKQRRRRRNPGALVNRINDQLAALGFSRYALANHPDLDVTPSTTYRFLSGTSDTTSREVDEMLRLCGLQVVPIEGVVPAICRGYLPLPEVSERGALTPHVNTAWRRN